MSVTRIGSQTLLYKSLLSRRITQFHAVTTCGISTFFNCEFNVTSSKKQKLATSTNYAFTKNGCNFNTCAMQPQTWMSVDKRGLSTWKSQPVTPLYLRAAEHETRVAVVDEHGLHSYGDILDLAHDLADKITETLDLPKSGNVKGERIALLCNNDMSYVVSQWASWLLEAVVVPLSPSHPASEWDYFLNNSGSSLVICTEDHLDKLQPVTSKLNLPCVSLSKADYVLCDSLSGDGAPSGSDDHHDIRQRTLIEICKHNMFKDVPALMVYTSGTTGRSKGVVHTHGSLQSMITDMVMAWGWVPSDVVLHVLPLHHVHGIVNVLMTPLYCGATCVMLPTFDAAKVWRTLLGQAPPALPRPVTVLMAVPTVYARLLDYISHVSGGGRGREMRRLRDYIGATCASRVRLMVSGSAALPAPVLEQWEDLTRHRLLERYGMTETGMVLTNPLTGTRTPGAVGRPFPSVEVCIARPNVYSPLGYDQLVRATARSTSVTPGCAGEEGELLVRGPSLFTGYWQNPGATAEDFTSDGWFKTGDTACYTDGAFRILGRTSVDIIKSGGYKISALDVERHLLAHPDITDVAVVGLTDVTWGQKVAAVVALRPGSDPLTLPQLKEWALELLPPYQLPTVLAVLPEIPRNALGKVNKVQLIGQVFAAEERKNKR